MAVLLVVAVDPRHRLHTRVFGGRGAYVPWVRIGVVPLMPVEDAAREGADQPRARLSARHRLHEAEDESEVAGDALRLQLLGGHDAFPCRR